MANRKLARTATPAGELWIRPAISFYQRFIGLLGRTALCRDEALLIYPCTGIHTLGMRFPIDVLFLDGDGRPLAQHASVVPWRLLMAPAGTVMTLELAGGRLDQNYCDGHPWSQLPQLARSRHGL